MMRRCIRLALLPVLLLGTASLGGCYVVPVGPRYAYAHPVGPVYAAPYRPYYWR